jgi:uracil-DNA glycosylase family 4
MKGFFSEKELTVLTDKKIDPENRANCNRCGIYRSVRTPKMPASGRGRLKCLIIGEAPGEEEDLSGSQFAKMGKAGNFLRTELASRGLDLDGDFYKCNAVNCRPTEAGARGGLRNRTPTDDEILYCRPLVDKAIRDLRPEVIWLMGGTAIDSFYKGVLDQHSIGMLRGLIIPDRKHNALIMPLYHPSYLVREDTNKNLHSVWKHDLNRAIEALSNTKEHWPEDIEPKVEIIKSFPDLIAALSYFQQQDEIAIDYETSGLKPFNYGHFIGSVALTNVQGLRTIAFPFERLHNWSPSEFRQIKSLLRSILTNDRIRKVGHNLKFENIWSSEIVGCKIVNQWWCTMIGAHLVDNRSYFTGLKLQAYLNFGVYPWDKEVDYFLKNADAQGFNKIHKAPLTELLLYNGMDTFWTARLKQKQENYFEQTGTLNLAFDFFMQGQEVLAKYEIRGMAADEEYYKKTYDDLGKQINSAYDAVHFSPEFMKYKEQVGKFPNIGSSDDLRQLVYEVCGQEKKIFTDKDKPSTDAEALRRTDCSFVPDLIKYRKLDKVRGTYLAQFLRFNFGGFIHTSINLHNMLTYRSSSDTPNFQNIPVRDKESQKTTRKGIKPRKGRVLLSSDLSGIEVGISCCYHQDPNLISYVKDKTKDMHRDSICDIFLLPVPEVTKELRFNGKNAWVFPQFYGSYYKNCARDLYERCWDLKTTSGIVVMEHMREKGIKRYEEFEEHCKGVEDKFWGVRFAVYKKWKDDIEELYRKQGYIESHLGFRFSGYMTRNELCNYQTQGTAFHCLLWLVIQVDAISILEDWKSVGVMEIHDELIHDAFPENVDHICDTMDDLATKKMIERFPWINVPVRMEHEISEVDGSWAEMEFYR